LRRSLASRSYKFQVNGKFCYARYFNNPETGFFFNLGVKIILTDANGKETMYANLKHAGEAMKLGRGGVDNYIKRKTIFSFLNAQGEVMTYTARYADK
jgi:hypothetical protein